MEMLHPWYEQNYEKVLTCMCKHILCKMCNEKYPTSI